jgi:hypothetical protein
VALPRAVLHVPRPGRSPDGEASEFRWKDVDLGRKRFEVRRRCYRGTIASPQTKYGRRAIGGRHEPWVAFHVFRHAWATVLFRGGWNAKQVQGGSGTTPAALTLSVCVHLLPDALSDPSFLDAEGGNRTHRNAP